MTRTPAAPIPARMPRTGIGVLVICCVVGSAFAATVIVLVAVFPGYLVDYRTNLYGFDVTIFIDGYNRIIRRFPGELCR